MTEARDCSVPAPGHDIMIFPPDLLTESGPGCAAPAAISAQGVVKGASVEVALLIASPGAWRRGRDSAVTLNVDGDLSPFQRINPCGYQGLRTVDLLTIGVQASPQDVAQVLSHKLATYLAP